MPRVAKDREVWFLIR